MKLILFSGDHPRHLFVNRDISRYFDETLVIVMRREHLIPEAPSYLQQTDKKLFERHFNNRYEVEKRFYGNLKVDDVFKDNILHIVDSECMNSERISEIVSAFNADFCFIFGVDMIHDPILSVLPKNKVNLHLGLSPWYKGSATLFWPFYHLSPQFCGITFHQITKEADAGEIIHQSVPELDYGDTIHIVGAKCVLKARDDTRKLFNYWNKNKSFKGKAQKTSGRNWRGLDFHASHLRVIYDLFDDDIVDRYLSGNLGASKPKLFTCID